MKLLSSFLLFIGMSICSVIAQVAEFRVVAVANIADEQVSLPQATFKSGSKVTISYPYKNSEVSVTVVATGDKGDIQYEVSASVPSADGATPTVFSSKGLLDPAEPLEYKFRRNGKRISLRIDLKPVEKH